MGGRGGTAPLLELAVVVADCVPAEEMGDKPGNMFPTGERCNCGGCCD